MSKSLEGSNL